MSTGHFISCSPPTVMLKRLSTFIRLTPSGEKIQKNEKSEKQHIESIEPSSCPSTTSISGISTSEPVMAPSAMPDATNGVNGISATYDYPPPNPKGDYRVLQQYHSKPSKLRVACAGAGASGLCLAYKMEKMLIPDSWELTLYEKNPMFGGTWYENTYPGVACDIPAHDYNFTWDPKPDWTQFFASGKEIQGYFEDFAERHGSKKYMQLNSKIIEARWDDSEGVWDLTIENPKTKEQRKEWAHVFVNGTGILNTWKWPEIEGLHDFKGPVLHSANWDHNVEFKGKSTAIIGVGSTSVQITPALQKICKEVKVFMRSPTWISPPFGTGALTSDLQKDQDVDPGQRQYTFTEEDKKRFRDDPEYHLDFRKRIEAEINGVFGMYIQNSELSTMMRDVITKEMHRRMGPGNEELKKFITPKFAPGCRRISPGDGFLESLVQDNVTPVFEGIKRVVPEGIETVDGTVHKVENLVCATGFQVAFQPAFTVINGEGKSIKEDWTDGPNLYFGVSAPRCEFCRFGITP